MHRWPARWFRHLTIGQKLLVAFGAILTVLILSFGTLLLYLAHVNSYVDRHQRITVPAVITAAEMRRELSRLREDFHVLIERPSGSQETETLRHAESLRARMKEALNIYSSRHAARTHPILFGMLSEHRRIDLADREDAALAAIRARLGELDQHPSFVPPSARDDRPDSQQALQELVEYEQTVAELERHIDTLIDVHREINTEMKLEGDRLVKEAGLIVLAITCLLAGLVVTTYVVMRRSIALPLRRLSVTADRVAHCDLDAQFEPWPNRDEVGTLTASLCAMVSNLREQTAAIVRKTRELESFTYSVAHDLKAPLREIEGFSSILEKRYAESPDAEPRRYIEIIRRSALRLTHMIDALLKYARIEQQELPRHRFTVSDLIDGLIGDRARHGPDPQPAVAVDIPFSDLYGEPVSIRQALANLLDNALKFSRPSMMPVIRIGGIQTVTDRILWISDNGIGIDPEHHERIFELFERLPGPQDYEGTGVGLAIVKTVMQKHGGRVWVKSIPGEGSTFYLAFPDPGA
jgi:signal transduction histidine kinase